MSELRIFSHQIVLDVLDFPGPHQEITKILGVEPTDAHIAGEMRTKTAVFKRSAWYFYSGADDYYSDFDDHVVSFLSIFESRKSAIAEVKRIAKVEITILGRFAGESRPAVHFDLRFLKFLSDNELPVEIDFGVWGKIIPSDEL